MTEKLPVSTCIFIDRRQTGRGKSIPNRQRLLRRIKDAIRQARPEDIDAGGVKSMSSTRGNANPVKVTKRSLHEPAFHYDHHSGEHDIVLIGNDRWERGDDFPLEGEEDGEQGVGGPGEDGEDDFIINISRDEFYNVFFEDCELPDLLDTHEKELPELVPKHAGFQKEGNPAQLNVVRSYKNALPRRKALTTEARNELEELEQEYKNLADNLALLMMSEPNAQSVGDIHERMSFLEVRITELREKISAVPFFEKLDLRYSKKEKVLVKSADAVFVVMMDISGSMDEAKKRMARKFFTLQYAFIKKRYPQTDLIFIAHTDEAEEVTEEEFFTTRKSGGTIVSPAYKLLHEIINARYDANDTNIYLSQASDGDNWDSDNINVIPELEESGLLAKLRHMSYVQVGESFASSYTPITLWTVLQAIANSTKKLSMARIESDNEVFEVFHRIYKKKNVVQ